MKKLAGCAAPIVAALLLVASSVTAQEPSVPRVVLAALGSRGAMGVRWPRMPAIDRAAELVRLPDARARFDVSGRGATVCVVDTGVDLRHRDFRDALGHTRVRWALDLARAPRGNHTELERIGGGAVLDAAEIDAALAAGDMTLPVDSHGHGTAVASLALGDDASDGTALAGPLAGIAPAADLVVVFALRPGVPGFEDEDLARGADFCLAAATDPTRLVIVLALGGHDGAHDGSDPLERELASVVADGAQVVVSAGNEGGAAIHATATLRANETVTVPVFVPAPAGADGERHVAIVVAMDGRASLEVALRAPDLSVTRWVAPGVGDAAIATVDHAGGRLVVDGSAAPREGGARVVYAIATGGGDVGTALAGGSYALSVRGSGRFDAWIAGVDVGAALLSPTFAGPFADATETVAVPGTAPEVITVGAVVSRARWVGGAGELVEAGAEGEVAAFSSVGPARSGAPKPDLVAPGSLIVAALSRDVREGDPQNLVAGSGAVLALRRSGDDRITVSGTSFAAPIVAGALALALERSPSRGELDRRLLAFSARASTRTAWSPREGAGTLDIASFLSARERELDGLSDGPSSSVSLTHTGATALAENVFLVARARTLDGTPSRASSIRIMRDETDVLYAPMLGGLAITRVPVPFAPVGHLVRYRALDEDGTDLGVATLRIQLDDARMRAGASVGGGGCSASARHDRGPLLGACLVALALLLSRRANRHRLAHARRPCRSRDDPAR